MEYCIDDGVPCDNCPCWKNCCNLEKECLDLINRQKELINGLIAGQETLQKHLADKQGQIEKFEKIEHFATKTIDTQHAEIERLKDELHRAKVEISKHFDYMDEYTNESLDVFADILKIKLNRTIDNLVKEREEK